MAASMQHFTVQECKAALCDILEAFHTPENITRMDEAKGNAANDMLKSMQVVFPVATQIEMEVIEKYGFPADGDGLIRFTQAVKVYEKQDPEIAQMNNELRAILLPPLANRAPVTANGTS